MQNTLGASREKMSMEKWLSIPGIPSADADVSESTCPGKVYFLQRDYICRYWDIAELPADKLEKTAAFAERIGQDAHLRLLAWHLSRHCNFIPMSQYKGYHFPDLIDELGIDTGLLYLLVALSMIPVFVDRAKREGFPVEYALSGAKRIGTLPVFFAQNYNGAFGIQGKTMAFLLHYRETAMWRIGRLDFAILKDSGRIPEIYRKDGKVIAFCPDGTMLDDRGRRINDPEQSVRIVTLSSDAESVTGYPIDTRTSSVSADKLTIKLSDGWEKIAGRGDWTLFFHIPGGGRMTLDSCRESFVEALKFFREYVPDKKFRLFWSSSWIFNPAWKDYLPDSNMVKLMDSGYLFPSATADKNPGLYFVFGKREGTPADFTAGNSMQRAFLQCFRDDRLQNAGFFIPADEI